MFISHALPSKKVGHHLTERQAEFFAYDENGAVFINLEKMHSIAVVDAGNKKLIATWPMEGCELPRGLALNTKTNTLFSGCDKALMVVDSKTGKVRQSVPIGEDCVAFTSIHQQTMCLLQQAPEN